MSNTSSHLTEMKNCSRQQTQRRVADVLGKLDDRNQVDPDVDGALLFGLVYPTGHKEIEDLVRAGRDSSLFSNALNPLPCKQQVAIERSLLDSLSAKRSSMTTPTQLDFASCCRRPLASSLTTWWQISQPQSHSDLCAKG